MSLDLLFTELSLHGDCGPREEERSLLIPAASIGGSRNGTENNVGNRNSDSEGHAVGQEWLLRLGAAGGKEELLRTQPPEGELMQVEVADLWNWVNSNYTSLQQGGLCSWACLSAFLPHPVRLCGGVCHYCYRGTPHDPPTRLDMQCLSLTSILQDTACGSTIWGESPAGHFLHLKCKSHADIFCRMFCQNALP